VEALSFRQKTIETKSYYLGGVKTTQRAVSFRAPEQLAEIALPFQQPS
jgi:hypothetical protein